MKHIRRIPLATFALLAVLAGLASIVAGIYLLGGLPAALITGGGLAAAVGLLADV